MKKSMNRKLVFLGTGASIGVPMIGCLCDVCQSNDPLNKRLRPSALIYNGNQRFLIDVGPDFRTQALTAHVTTLDGLLLTHAHQDHTAGLDDLRPICYYRKSSFPILLSEATAKDILSRYHYLFEPDEKAPFPRFNLHTLTNHTGHTVFEGLPIEYVSYTQGGMQVNGFLIGDLAYLSDIRHFDPSIFEHLKGVKTLIISALRYTPSLLHFSIDEAIDFANQLKVEKVWLTHISHEIDHHRTNAYLPPHIRLAYDGLIIDFN